MIVAYRPYHTTPELLALGNWLQDGGRDLPDTDEPATVPKVPAPSTEPSVRRTVPVPLPVDAPKPRAVPPVSPRSVGSAFFAQPGVELFKDQYGVGHARYPVSGHAETHRLRSTTLTHALVRWATGHGIWLSRRAALDQIDHAAAFAEERVVELSNRSAWDPTDRGVLWVDQTDPAWRAFRVTATGWSLVADPPALFHRFAHQRALPDPDPSGDLREFTDYLPQLASDEDRLLVLAWVATAWLPIARPILAFVGTHGAAKSTATAFVRRLLDPSRTELLGKDARADLPLTFHKHAVPAFDNLDALAPTESDLFCQAVTGRGIARRQLYTDDGEFILSFRRPVLVNGLRLPTARADFLDRCLVVELDRIAPAHRLSARRVEERFAAAAPRLVGGVLNALAGAMRALPTVPEQGLGRMADFHLWGRAVAVALGSRGEAFDAAYRAAEARQRAGAADNTLAQAVLLFARATGHWEGTPADLFDRLAETARDRQLRRTPEFWPDSPAGLGRLLKHLGETLADYGVRVSRPRRTTARRVLIEYDPSADRLGADE